eukprot:NODE_97_length_21155_cov_0.234850.p6 type:complete len:279 gc:universal NODE_97_length_21155_cov_0.234850:7056-7892(+)
MSYLNSLTKSGVTSPSEFQNRLSHADRNRSKSMQGFEETSSRTTSKNINLELKKLVESAPDNVKPFMKKEMDDFYMMFNRYLSEKARGQSIDWSKIKSPAPEQIVAYSNLPEPKESIKNYLDKLAVIKLNGGLGTSMGCVGPKSAIEVRDGSTFLDLTVRQIEYLNDQYESNVSLILMNSFNTDDETKKVIRRYNDKNVKIMTFNQSRYPRFYKDSVSICPNTWDDDKGCFYPPGHGDLYQSLYNSGILQSLIDEGKEFVFVSNIDNLGATVDESNSH